MGPSVRVAARFGPPAPALALAVLVLGPTPMPATAQDRAPSPGVRVDQTDQYYTLDEPTLSGVIRRLNEMRLEDGSGTLAQGLTEYRILPDWRPWAAGGRCRVSALTLNVRIVITLPEWSQADTAPISERRRWERIEEAIRTHEYRHRDLTLQAAARLYDRLASLETRGCSALQGAFSGEMSVAESRLTDAHATFDRETPARIVGH